MTPSDDPRCSPPPGAELHDDWFRTAFGSEYSRVYRHRNCDAGRGEVARAREWLQLADGAPVLDLCCGAGRHLRALEDLGLDAIGLDLSEDLLRQARAIRPTSRLVRGDMRALPFDAGFGGRPAGGRDGGFEGVFSFFTSFGYFFEHAQHRQVLSGIARALSPQGRFLIDVPDRDSVQRALVPHSERRDGELHIEERRWIRNDRVEKEVCVTSKSEPDKPDCYCESVRLFEYAEIEALCAEVGLVIHRAFGSFERGEAYQPGSTPRMILVGGKS